MTMTTTFGAAVRASPPPLAGISGPDLALPLVDPLDDDEPGDVVVVTTRRALCRIALVATETGGRFQREGVAHDPMAWMLSPRRLFGGAAAIDACLARDACLRGVLVHGLSLGLDADPSEVDELTGEDEDEAVRSDGIRDPHGVATTGKGGDVADRDGVRTVGDASEAPPQVERLFTATVVSSSGTGTVQAFHASLARCEAEIAGRLVARMGAACTGAVIVEGFDAGDPLVQALVAPAIADALAQIAADPASPLAAGLDLQVEQRFRG